MNRWIAGGLLAFGLLAGCRAIVGIDDLTYNPPRPDGGNNGPNGQGNDDAGGDDRDLDCQAAAGGCRQCCKNKYKAVGAAFEHDDRGKQCLCDANRGNCGRECSDSICSLLPLDGGGPPSNTCAACEDGVLSDPNAACGTKDCAGDQECENGVVCLQSCPR